jgi:hypothetical protein
MKQGRETHDAVALRVEKAEITSQLARRQTQTGKILLCVAGALLLMFLVLLVLYPALPHNSTAASCVGRISAEAVGLSRGRRNISCHLSCIGCTRPTRPFRDRGRGQEKSLPQILRDLWLKP